jgi:adenylate cyclase
VSQDRPQRKLVVIVHADVAGYSTLMTKDEDLAHRRVSEAFDMLGDFVARYGGRVAEKRGDALLAEFTGPSDALGAALAFQGALAEHHRDTEDGIRPRMRIGINLGEVIADRGTLWGPGVNLAQRVEQVAPPGGVTVSDTVHNAISKALPVSYLDLGEQQVKESVLRVYEARLLEGKGIAPPGSIATFSTDHAPTPGPHPGPDASLALPAEPSIAVLPFANLSNDPEQAYFVDGMMEEITAALSRVRSIFVIASGSTQSFRERKTSPQEIGRQLGVRYVLEGSVRKAASKVRIGVTLVDAGDGAQIWASRFEDTLDDVFALQDRVALGVAGVIEPAVRDAEARLAEKRPTENMGSYDLFLRASTKVDTYEKDEMFAALDLLNQSVALDPDYALAFSLAAYCHAQIVVTGWSDDADGHRRQAISLARRALRIGNDDAEVLSWIVGTYLPLDEDLETSIALIDRSIELNPGSSFAWHMSGWLRAAAGESECAVEHFETAMRLDPLSVDRFYLLSGIALARFNQHRFEEAVALLKESLQLQGAVSINQALLAASYGHLGRASEARAALERYRELSPVDVRERTTLFHVPEYRRAYLAGIALADGTALDSDGSAKTAHSLDRPSGDVH